MYDPSIHYRRSIRLKSFDYRTPGAYVVTVCTHQWVDLLATVMDKECVLSPAGEMIEATWYEMPGHYPGLDVDAFVVMPNHVHGIFVLTAGGDQFLDSSALSLPDAVQRFKSLTTHRYMEGVSTSGWQRFDGRLWHRNYFERVIRDERELERFREYIENNPAMWEKDTHNPDVKD